MENEYIYAANETSIYVTYDLKSSLINYNGLTNCNYKIVNNKLKIFECNLRLSGDISFIKKYELHQVIKLYCKHSCKNN